MSNIKDLKDNPTNNINIVDLLVVLNHEHKPKYTETLLRILKKKFSTEESKDYQIKETIKLFPFLKEENLAKLSPLELVAFNGLFTSFFTQRELDNFYLFCSYNERDLVENNDLSKYNDFEEIVDNVKVITDKQLEKEMGKQIVKLYDEGEWLMVRPLTWESSKKYGSNTKWCTTSNGSESTFESYITKGMLFYVLNRKTNIKVACFKSLSKSSPEFSFWNAKDDRVDSMDCGVPNDVLKMITIETNNPNARTNKDLASKVTNSSLFPLKVFNH